ncbi:hypothetical protein TNCV_4562341 [Trichonephila clavipes]|nr:hypothetical protein TNCV_4562341 [Trichonephila clavipes]
MDFEAKKKDSTGLRPPHLESAQLHEVRRRWAVEHRDRIQREWSHVQFTDESRFSLEQGLQVSRGHSQRIPLISCLSSPKSVGSVLTHSRSPLPRRAVVTDPMTPQLNPLSLFRKRADFKPRLVTTVTE